MDPIDGTGADEALSEAVTTENSTHTEEELSKAVDAGEMRMDPSADEVHAAADDAATDTASPVQRKSHRPSLEVVDVKIDAFYDKSAFKQGLQVRCKRA